MIFGIGLVSWPVGGAYAFRLNIANDILLSDRVLVGLVQAQATCLRLEGCIVTLDAMGCQKAIAERIRAKGADYLLVRKPNHGRAFEAVREHLERTCFGLGSGGRPVFDAFEESHGRLVRRRVFVDPAAKDLEPWATGPTSTPSWRWRRSAA